MRKDNDTDEKSKNNQRYYRNTNKSKKTGKISFKNASEKTNKLEDISS